MIGRSFASKSTRVFRGLLSILVSPLTYLIALYGAGAACAVYGFDLLFGPAAAMLVTAAFLLFGARFIARGMSADG